MVAKKTRGGIGLRMHQAETLSVMMIPLASAAPGRWGSLEDGRHPIPVAHEGPGKCNEVLADNYALADLDIALGLKAENDRACRNEPAVYDLHAGTARPMENRGHWHQ